MVNANMSLNHMFAIVETEKKPCASKREWGRIDFEALYGLLQERVDLHDDVLGYIRDSIAWIESYNPSTQEAQSGLNLYGITVINTPSAGPAAAIFSAWADLFCQGPQQLELTGRFVWREGAPASGGEYETLHFSRDSTVSSLRAIAAALTRVAASDGREYLLHLGI